MFQVGFTQINTKVQDPREMKNLKIFQTFTTRFFKGELVQREVSDDRGGLAMTSSGMLGGEF